MNFLTLLKENEFILFDGGLGTLLQAKGLPAGEMPEIFALKEEDTLLNCHRAYVQAGARVITTNTFGANRFKLPAGISAYEVNKKMALVAKRAAENRALVAGSVGPSGKMVRPLGDIDFLDLVDSFSEQIQGLIYG